MRTWARQALAWKGNNLHVGGKGKPVLAIEPDAWWPSMWRVKYQDGSLSDRVNLSRARDAAMSIALCILQGEEPRLEASPTAILVSPLLVIPSAPLPGPSPQIATARALP
jgi:hypothetical protein